MTERGLPQIGGNDVTEAWQAVIAVTVSIELPPDPHFMDAIGGNHRLVMSGFARRVLGQHRTGDGSAAHRTT
jgi:hypothetical protein